MARDRPIDWNSPYIRRVTERDTVRHYDSTPGFAPKRHGRSAPVGALVEIADPAFIGGSIWRGVVRSHMMWTDDNTYTGLSIVECTDPVDFPDYRTIGRAEQVEIKHVTVIG
ncbi:hypothetical protein GCM10010466_39430 [Planomonospora alba]|uniref:Uncharacterized protein n=1 Tax=Planomonospora alba TaxID=161354 RepID=A0ABP6ND81_9ACTN